MAFRAPLLRLIKAYRNGGIPAFLHDHRAGRVPPGLQPVVVDAVNTVARTIVVNPVHYAGGALDRAGRFFGFRGRRQARNKCISASSAEEALGEVLVPGVAPLVEWTPRFS